MKHSIEDIINKSTDIDETDLNSMPLTHNQIFQMGCFYQWAQQFLNDNLKRGAEYESWSQTTIEVPEYFIWVMEREWIGDNDGEFVCWR